MSIYPVDTLFLQQFPDTNDTITIHFVHSRIVLLIVVIDYSASLIPIRYDTMTTSTVRVVAIIKVPDGVCLLRSLNTDTVAATAVQNMYERNESIEKNKI